MDRWFYTKDGKNKVGPVSFSMLQQMAVSGIVQPNDMVYQEGTRWMQAKTIPDLFEPAQAVPVEVVEVVGTTWHGLNWADLHAKLQAWFVSLSKAQRWAVIGGVGVMFLLCLGICAGIGGFGTRGTAGGGGSTTTKSGTSASRALSSVLAGRDD